MDILEINSNDITKTITENTFDNITKSFEDVMKATNQINANGGNPSVSEVLVLQNEIFKYNFYQEVITKVVSKSVTTINEVMKAQ